MWPIARDSNEVVYQIGAGSRSTARSQADKEGHSGIHEHCNGVCGMGCDEAEISEEKRPCH